MIRKFCISAEKLSILVPEAVIYIYGNFVLSYRANIVWSSLASYPASYIFSFSRFIVPSEKE